MFYGDFLMFGDAEKNKGLLQLTYNLEYTETLMKYIL